MAPSKCICQHSETFRSPMGLMTPLREFLFRPCNAGHKKSGSRKGGVEERTPTYITSNTKQAK